MTEEDRQVGLTGSGRRAEPTFATAGLSCDRKSFASGPSPSRAKGRPFSATRLLPSCKATTRTKLFALKKRCSYSSLPVLPTRDGSRQFSLSTGLLIRHKLAHDSQRRPYTETRPDAPTQRQHTQPTHRSHKHRPTSARCPLRRSLPHLSKDLENLILVELPLRAGLA